MIPSYLVWAIALVIPGVAIVRLITRRIPILTLLAVAAPISYGGVYLLGLIFNRVGLPVVTATAATIGLVVVAWLVLEVVRLVAAGPELRKKHLKHIGGRLRGLASTDYVVAAVVVIGIVVVAYNWHRFQLTFVFPPGWDAMHHGYFAKQIATYQTLDTSIVLAPTAGEADGPQSFYPLGFNLLTALLHNVTGIPISRIMLAGTTVTAGLLLPLSAVVMARLASPRHTLVAAFSAIAAGLPFVLFWVLEPGRINAVLSLALIPGVVCVLLWGFRHFSWRLLPVAALAVAGLTGVHASEVVVPAIVAACVVAVAVITNRAYRDGVHWLVWAGLAHVAGIVPILLLDSTIFGAAAERSGTLVDTSIAQMTLPQAIGQILTPGFDLGTAFGAGSPSPFYGAATWGILVAVGCVATIAKKWRAFSGFAIAYVLFAVLCIGLASGNLGKLSILTLPWYGDLVRLSWNLTVLGIIPAAVAIAMIAQAIGSTVGWVTAKIAARGRTQLSPRVVPLVAICVAAVSGLALAIGGALPPAAAASAMLADTRGPARADSRSAFEFLRDNVAEGDRVFDDVRIDGSLWMYVDYGVLPLFGNSPFVGFEPESWLERLWVRENIESIDTDSCVATVLDRYNVTYLYYGDRHMNDAEHKIDLGFLQSNKHFTEVFTEGDAHVFAITLPDSIPPCSEDLTPKNRNSF